MKTIDTKAIYEVLPNLSGKKVQSTCRKCGKRMQILGELISISWNDYLDGSGEIIDLCEPCAELVIRKIKDLIKSGK